MENGDVITTVRAVKEHFTVSMVLKKSTPPVKLIRKVKIKPEAAGSHEICRMNSSDGVLEESKNDTPCKSKRRRQFSLDKSLARKSVEMDFLNFLNGSSEKQYLDSSEVNDDSSFISINSDNMKDLMSCVDDELKAKVKKTDDETAIKKQKTSKSSELDTVDGEVNICSVHKGTVYELEPVFSGYQLVGDSQLLRFAQYILGMSRKIDKDGRGWLGLCVGGQRICDLHKRVLDDVVPVGKQLILLIGTNDLLKDTSIVDMCKGLRNLLRSLFKAANKIKLLTLPPVPKLAYLNDHWVKLKKYNDFIFLLKDSFRDRLDVVDISPLFYQRTLKKCNLGLFELWFEGPLRRPDLIHINEAGFKLIRDLLLKEV